MKFAHVRFSFAVLAAYVTRGRNDLPDPRAMVLEPVDVPPGWKRKSDRTFRTGLMSPDAPWAERLRHARGTSYIIAYRDPNDPWALIVSQAFPFVNAADAMAAFPLMEDRLLTNPDMSVVETRRSPVELVTAPGDEYRALSIESTKLGEWGSQGVQLLVLWRHGSVIGFLTVSGRTGRYTVGDLEALATCQDQRIVEALARPKLA